MEKRSILDREESVKMPELREVVCVGSSVAGGMGRVSPQAGDTTGQRAVARLREAEGAMSRAGMQDNRASRWQQWFQAQAAVTQITQVRSV